MTRTSTALDQGKYGRELAHHKAKIRTQKEEIDKLKRSIKAQNVEITNLRKSNAYLLKTAEPEARARMVMRTWLRATARSFLSLRAVDLTAGCLWLHDRE